MPSATTIPLVHDWKQDHFYGMKSFLNRTFVNGNGNAGFLGERGYGTIRFKTTEDVERQARMMFLTGRRVDEPDCARSRPRTSRRKKKRRSTVPRKTRFRRRPPSSAPGPSWWSWRLQPGEREFFARAIVNRIWYRLFGQGLVMPLDQMHSANPPSHPELLAWLARDMATHGYDLRRLDPRPGHERGLCPQLALGRRGTAPAVAVRRRPGASPDARRNWRPRSGWRPSIPRACRRTCRSEPFEKRIEALEAGAGPLAASFTNSSGDSQIGVAEALLFSNGKRIDRELLADGPDRLVGRLEADRGTAEADRPGRSQRAVTAAR